MARPKQPLVKIICKNCKKEIEKKWYETSQYCSKKCSSSCPEMIAKRNASQKKTNLERYGAHPMSLKEVKDKHAKVMIERHGVPNALKLESLVEKVKQTKLERYGDETYCNTEKIKNTKIERYGTQYTPGNGGVTKKAVDRLNRVFFESLDYIPLFDKLKVGDDLNKYFYFKCNKCSKVFKFKKSNLREPLCRCSYKGMYTKHSKNELEIYDFLLQNNVEVIRQDRKILSGYELDFILPQYNIAIEVNGLYWHSEKAGKTRDYHLNKTIECKNKGIQLIHITDSDWMLKKDIVKSLLLSKIGKTKNIMYAKNFYVKLIPNNIKDSFLEENHLQGKDISAIRIGLYNKINNELYSIVTFTKSRFDKNYEYELGRYCTLKDHTIVGGFNKLLKYFIINYNPKNILTYSDADYNTGDIYLKNGFKYMGMTPPSYFYVRNNEIISRYVSQKHKLNKFLTNYNKDLSELENMRINGYSRYWTCGNHKFVKEII